MATDKTAKSTVDELREIKKREAILIRQRHFECDHNDGKVMYLSQYDGVVEGSKKKYSETTVIHPKNRGGCGVIFEAKPFTENEVTDTFFNLESMCHQIKMISGKGLSDKNREDLCRCMEYIEYLRGNLEPYYNSMVKALKDDKNQNQKRGERKVGGIGIDSSIFA